MIRTVSMGCNNSMGAMTPVRRNRLRGWGGYRNMRGLGQDGTDGVDTSGFSSLDFSAIDTGSYVPPADAQFSTAEPGSTTTPQNVFTDTTSGQGLTYYNLGNGQIVDQYGTTYFGDGSQITALGTYTDSAGNTFFTDGSEVTANGTYIDPQGNAWPPDSAQAKAAQSAAASGAGSGGASAGRSGGGGGGGSQSSLQQLICAFNPRAAGCPQAGQAAIGTTPTVASGFSSWWNQNWGWVVGGGAALLVLPPLLGALTDDGGGGRRR